MSGGGPSQNTNSYQATNQNFSDISSMIQDMMTKGLTNTSSATSNVGNTTVNQNTTGTNFNNTTGGYTGTTGGTSTGATTGSTAFANNPWAPAMPALNNILGQIGGISMNLTPAQQAALSATQASAGSMPDFGNPATNAVTNMFSSQNGIPEAGLWGGAYGNYAQSLSPFTTMANLNPMNTPGFADALFDPVTGANARISDNIKAQFNAAGRDWVGNADASKSIAMGEKAYDDPLIAQQYNTNVGNYLGSAQANYNAAANTAQGVTGLFQTPIQNEQAGMAAAAQVPGLWMNPSMAQLGAANTAYGLPFSNIALPAGMVSNIAQLGQQGTGTSAGTQTGATTGTSGGTNFSNTMGGNTSNMTGGTTNNQFQTTAGTTTTQKDAQATSTGQQQGNQAGTSIGNSTTTQNTNPFGEVAGIGLGLATMFA